MILTPTAISIESLNIENMQCFRLNQDDDDDNNHESMATTVK